MKAEAEKSEAEELKKIRRRIEDRLRKDPDALKRVSELLKIR